MATALDLGLAVTAVPSLSFAVRGGLAEDEGKNRFALNNGVAKNSRVKTRPLFS